MSPHESYTNGPQSDAASRTPSSLLEKARIHDPEVWHRLADLYGPLIYYWCRQRGLQTQDAADVYQEVLVAVWTGIRGFRHDPGRGRFRGWLRRITENKIRDYFKRQAGSVKAGGGSDAQRRLAEIADQRIDDSTEEKDGAEIASLYARALELVRAEFEDRTWEAFWRLAVEGDKAADVAADYGFSASAARQAKSRVLRRLRAEFADLIE